MRKTVGEVWFKAINVVYVEKNGKTKTFINGDWGQMGRQQARQELTKGNIKILKANVLQSVQDLTDCSILTRGLVYDDKRARLGIRYPGLPMNTYQGFPQEMGRYLIWDMGGKLNQDLILVGFTLLQKWQLACPLVSYDTLAENVGDEQERAKTKAVIHDLRIPLYDTRIIFARQCEQTRKLFERWDGTQLGFLRALYQTPMRVLALPPSWVME